VLDPGDGVNTFLNGLGDFLLYAFGETPGYFVMMEITGISTFGYVSTESQRYENIPTVIKTRHMTVANTGRLMERSEIIMMPVLFQRGYDEAVPFSDIKAALDDICLARFQPLCYLHSVLCCDAGRHFANPCPVALDHDQSRFFTRDIPAEYSGPRHLNNAFTNSRHNAPFDKKTSLEFIRRIVHIGNHLYGAIRFADGGVDKHDLSRKRSAG